MEHILELYRSGASIRSIVKTTNVSRQIVRKILIENNIAIRKRTHTFDENFFSVIDSNLKAYFLGFIFADGYVAQASAKKGAIITIEISYKDIDVLIAFAQSVKYSGDIKVTYKKRGEEIYKYALINLCSKKMSEDLLALGLLNNKTKNISFPSVSKKFIPSFMLGFSDGDGSVFYNQATRGNSQWRLVCHENLVEPIKKIIYEVTKTQPCVQSHWRTSYIKVISLGGRSALNWLEWMYKDAPFTLSRKKEKYEKIQNSWAIGRYDNLRNSSPHKGVSWSVARQKWVAQRQTNGMKAFFGRYDTEQEAIDALNRNALEKNLD